MEEHLEGPAEERGLVTSISIHHGEDEDFWILEAENLYFDDYAADHVDFGSLTPELTKLEIYAGWSRTFPDSTSELPDQLDLKLVGGDEKVAKVHFVPIMQV